MKPLYLLGDIHGEFENLKKIIRHYGIGDCILICVGDFGIGFNHPLKDASKMRDLDRFMRERRIDFKTIRGNHDDPSYFVSPRRLTDLTNIEFIPDYSKRVINGETFLFVGGATSVDRIDRKVDFSYWRDEAARFTPDRCAPADILITHTAPSWLGPFDKDGISSYCDRDLTLWEDCKKERFDIDRILDIVKPKRLYCGHFHRWQVMDHGGCIGTILDINQIIEHRNENIDPSTTSALSSV